MWIFTTSGFVSMVADRSDPDRLLVRGRVRADVERFAREIGVAVQSTPDADYPYRFTASKADIAQAFSRMVMEIDYPNFKNEVARRQGRGRESAYHEVWALLQRTLPALDKG